MLFSFAFADWARAENSGRAEVFAMDEAGFGVFYRETGPRLLGYLQRCLGNRALAEDLLQDAFLKFLRSGFTGKDDADRTRYLFGIATNLVRDHFRSPKSREIEFTAEAAPAAQAAFPLEGSDVGKALAALSPRDRAMLWLAHVEGLTPREIARSLDLKPSSMKSMMFRARQRLAARLRALGLVPSREVGR